MPNNWIQILKETKLDTMLTSPQLAHVLEFVEVRKSHKFDLVIIYIRN